MKTVGTLSVMLLFVVAILGLSSGDPIAEAEQGEEIDLHVLYVGSLGSERGKDFVEFLKKHFIEVMAVAPDKFDVRLTDRVDVTLLDWDVAAFGGPSFPKSYARPTIMIGGPAAHVAGRLRLKIGYL